MSEVCVTCRTRKGFANSTSSRWGADASELTSSWASRFSKVKLTLARLISSPVHSEPGGEGTPTDYSKGQAVFDEGAVHFLCVSWNTANRLLAPLVMPPSVSILKKTVGPSMVRNRSWSTCVISVPLQRHFFHLYCNPRSFSFPLPQNYVLCPKAFVANPTINK